MLGRTVSSGSSNEHLRSQTSVKIGKYKLWIIDVSYTVFTILIASVLTLKAFSRYIARFFSCLDFVEVNKIVSLYILGLV